jgi:chemotaxis-related protein WspD
LLDRPLLPEFRRERTAHYAKPKQLAAPAKTSALLFRIRTDWLALPTQAFQEVAEHRLVHSLPHRRRSIVLGVVNIRGELLICVSLGHLLGLEQTQSGRALRRTHERLLVANWKGNRLVFPVDEVRGVHRFQELELQEPPATLAKANLSYTRGLLSWQGRAVGFLDADRLFSALNRSPWRIGGSMTEKALAGEDAISIGICRWQFDHMFAECLVDCRASNLDHLKPFGTLEHAMANQGRLKHHIASFHDERFTLVFIDHTHPSAADGDHLENHGMKVDPIGNRTAVGNGD